MCYFYLGMLEKSHFYHERALNHDYEIEQSPLRQMGIDSIRIYLEKNYPQNVGKHIGIPLMNCLSLHVPNEQIHVPVPEFEILFISQDRKDSTNRKSRRSISPLKKQQNSQSPLNKKSVFKRIFNGKEILEQILEEKEFEFEIYTPKHSFRSEALSFMKIKEEKFRKEIFVNKRLIAKSFSINDLGIIPNAPTLSRIENPMKYKLPLEKQIEIRLRKNYDLGSTITRIHQRVTFHQTELSRRNDKICINHKNIQREKEDLLKGRKKQIRNIQEALNGYITSLMQIGSDPKYLQ